MVKAKDLLNRDDDKNKDEGERVNEAYESLSKKLEAIRNGKEDEDEKEDEDLDKDMEKDEEEDKEDDESLKDFEDKNGEEPEEVKEDEELAPEEPKQTFTKPEADPLDKDSDLTEEEVKKENELDEPKEADVSDEADTLDDLIKDSEKPVFSSSSEASRETVEEREDMSIPPLGSSSHMQSSRPPITNYTSRFGSNRPVAKSASKWHVVVLILIGLAVIGGTVYFLKNQFKPVNTTPPASSATPVPTPSPSPTPTPLDRSKFKVRVLNGTAKSGLAATVGSKLKDLGYQQDRVGNATNSAFERTEIRSKAGATGLIEQLIRDLTPDYDAASSSSSLKDSDSADVEVILGAK